jgi:hypothetical protein
MTSWLPSVSRRLDASRQAVRLVAAFVVIGALALPASASAAVTIGATGGNGAADCPPDFTWAQDSTAVGSPSYVVPAGGGVITSWSHDRGPALATAQLRLKIFRKTGPNTYLTVGHSDFETLTAAGVNTFATQVEAEGGDILGFRLTAAATSCRRSGSTGDLAVASGPGQPDPPIGSSVSFGSAGAFLLNLAATVEPDCDGDGFGDETQDPDTSSCNAPTPKADRTLTLDANKGKVEKGRKVRLTGQIDAPQNEAGCEPNHTVELQRRAKKAPDTAFATFKTLQTDQAGNFAEKVKVKKTRIYRAQVQGSESCDEELSNTQKVRVQKKKAARDA